MCTGSYKFFENKDCEYFPCHRFPFKDFNCLFCYCPLLFDMECGGNYSLINSGLKDCSNCILPHKPENYDYIIKKLMDLYNK